MGMKKGQVSIFVILAILIVVGFGIFLLLRGESQKKELNREYFEQQGLQPSIKNIQDFILDCQEEVSREGLKRIGIQGGYHKRPDYYFDMDWAFIPYYYHEGLILMPTMERIEIELSSYVDDKINSCLDKINFKNFDLEYGDSETRTRIDKKKVLINTKFPVKIRHEGEITDFRLSKHELRIESYLNEIIEVAEYITDSHKKNSNLMCINCIKELAEERELYVDFISIKPDSTLVMILENKTMEEPYLFEFINKYNLEFDL